MIGNWSPSASVSLASLAARAGLLRARLVRKFAIENFKPRAIRRTGSLVAIEHTVELPLINADLRNKVVLGRGNR